MSHLVHSKDVDHGRGTGREGGPNDSDHLSSRFGSRVGRNHCGFRILHPAFSRRTKYPRPCQPNHRTWQSKCRKSCRRHIYAPVSRARGYESVDNRLTSFGIAVPNDVWLLSVPTVKTQTGVRGLVFVNLVLRPAGQNMFLAPIGHRSEGVAVDEVGKRLLV